MASASTYFVGFGVLALVSLVVNLGGLIAIAVKCPSNIAWLFFFWGKFKSFKLLSSLASTANATKATHNKWMRTP